MLGRKLKNSQVVHHIDHDKTNNQFDNLIVFSNTSEHIAFHSNNQDKFLLIKNEDGSYDCARKKYTCIDCGSTISYGCKRCIVCHKNYIKNIVSSKPQKDDLINAILQNKGNFLETGRMFGVSYAAVKKWCKSYGIPFHSCDYK